jgi:hypothetical protein
VCRVVARLAGVTGILVVRCVEWRGDGIAMPECGVVDERGNGGDGGVTAAVGRMFFDRWHAHGDAVAVPGAGDSGGRWCGEKGLGDDATCWRACPSWLTH